MDARNGYRMGWILGLGILLSQAGVVSAQNARTANFLVHAPTQQLADTVAQAAERYRDELAEYWLGRRLPRWSSPCPIKVVAGQLAAQGVTRYDRFTGSNFQMEVIGTPERILDSVLPHEVTHTVLATHFRGPLPRWADEGICTTVEHEAERRKHEIKLLEFLRTRRGIAMNTMFLLKEYPADMLPMYAQGYSVCRFLIEQSGPRQFVKFIEGYMQQQSWTENVRKHYGYESLEQLQTSWLAWVESGSGPVDAFVSARSRAAASVAASSSGRPGEDSATRSKTEIAASGGWYQRRIQRPGKEKPYSVSQPQPEVRYGEPAVIRR
ncbi:MAG: hypothetical protein AAF802_29555 [Planctomycetota bacterium]